MSEQKTLLQHMYFWITCVQRCVAGLIELRIGKSRGLANWRDYDDGFAVS